jgi:methylated-DNA-protein-cysteine methyltransferase-like protein
LALVLFVFIGNYLKMWKEVYKIVKKIPRGKVMTYGQIAQILKVKDTRKISWALHANKSVEVPCHRVVNKEGHLAKNFAFNGMEEQQRRLESEGIVFEKDLYVDLDKYGM